jgi:hypothetical protein
MGLQEQLNELRAQSAQRIPGETAAIMANAMAKLKQSGIVDKALKTGDKSPAFELVNTRGETVSSAALLGRGPLVISFYRGSW